MIISNSNERKGMILLVVIAFLAMFTVMGLTYILHADIQLKNSIDDVLALDMKEDPYKIIDLDPRVALDFFLEKFLYDQADGTTGGNAIRGQSLARNIYGGYVSGGFNDKAFAGIGKLNKDFEVAPAVNIKEWQLVNYSFNGAFNPERLNDGGSGVKTSTWNAPYTYPDHNNFYLGWLKSDGTKVIPSFHRDYIFGSMKPIDANPNWTNIKGKYLTPRPRPNEHPNFPYPDADGMDVKNLEGYPGGNDSIWIDVGSPVFTALDGRKYKIMVAPLILDLDGRINVNVAGNVMGTTNTHASNQGWGPWEVNLSTALGAPLNAYAITEAQQINLGYSAGGALLLPGVYGTAGVPGGTTLPAISATSLWGTNALTPHPYLAPTYSMLDFNAKSETGANAPISLSNSFASFPTFSGNYTSNVVTNEIGVGGSHPSFVNPKNTKIGNSKFTNNEMASLIRWSGQGSAPKATNLVNLLKNTLGADYIYDNSTMAIRNRITTLSADIQQSTLLPYSYTAVSPIVGYMKQINLNRSLANYPKAYLVRDVGTWDLTANPPRPNGFKSFKTESDDLTGANGGRYVDDPLTGVAYGVTLDAATKDRQDFAKEIFNGLKLATSVDPADTDAIRYLAQLAANMVDFIDSDDVMTRFIWGDPALDEYVFGVELPEVVINEVYSEIRNDPSDTFPAKFDAVLSKNRNPADKPFNCNFWVELVNSLPADVSNANLALLEQDPYVDGEGTKKRAPVYKIQILDGKDPALVTNIEGTPSLPVKSASNGFKPDASMDDPVAANCKYDNVAFVSIESYEKKVGRILHPVGTNYTGMEPITTADGLSGFIIIGPVGEFPSSDPTKATAPAPYTKFQYISNIRTPELKYDIPKTDPDFKANVIAGKIAAKKHTVVLRRLANPYMKPNEDKASANYNPYVTVDFVEDVPVNDAVTNSTEDERGKNATPAGPSTVATFSDRKSYNKVQPYRSSTTMVPSALMVPLADQPQHTFLRHNGSTVTAPPVVPLGALSTDTMLQLPFKWLMHLDRKLINSLEILNVSACKPQEVTQKFSNPIYVDSNNIKIENKASWLDESKKLYRFLALADVQGYQQGTAFAGRQIGKVNINNIWDKEIFNALCDANTNNNFTQAEGDKVFTNFLNSRSPSPNNEPALGDKPLWGFGVGKAAGGDDWTSTERGLCNSLFRLNTTPLAPNTGVGVFDLPNKDNSTPPVEIRNAFQEKELLSKIYNNITTKSNVFGVWITTGYFEVTDDTTNPPTLGAEIGKIAGRNIRHRMFAIVDRTNMSAFSTNLVDTGLQSTNPPPNPPTPLPTTPVPGVGACPNISAGMTVVNWNRTGVNQSGKSWSFSAGMLLTFDFNTDSEETVQLQDVGGGVLGATFTKSHGANCTIINRGNPGPWIGYDRTKDRDVVPYAEIIE